MSGGKAVKLSLPTASLSALQQTGRKVQIGEEYVYKPSRACMQPCLARVKLGQNKKEK
jgi:hypothetical protein